MNARALTVTSGRTEMFSPAVPTEMPKLGQDNTAGNSEGQPAPSPKCRRLWTARSPLKLLRSMQKLKLTYPRIFHSGPGKP